MWLSKRNGNTSFSVAEKGTVSVGGSSVLKTASTIQSEEVQNFAPYGYSAFAPDGEEILLINSANGAIGAGTKMKGEKLVAGEIAITSASGAKIKLCNDKSIEINGFVFTADGNILNSKGEKII